MNIIFFGSDNFAAAHLKALIDSPHHVRGCVTQPDRPRGRGMKVVISEIKQCAQDHNIPVLQPTSLKDAAFADELKGIEADVYVVIAYGRFLPDEILEIPSLGAINVHASLLPKYRGAAPINWAIMDGEKETGITIIKINSDMDAGDILAKTKIKIDANDTALTLREKMMTKGPDLLLQTLERLAENKCTFTAQDHNKATLAPKLTKELGIIQWTKDAKTIYNLIRGLLPWPGAYTFYDGKLLKILEAQVVNYNISKFEPGEVLEVDKEGITIAVGQNGLLVKKVHLQDSKPMDAHSFVVGHQIKPGFKFK